MHRIYTLMATAIVLSLAQMASAQSPIYKRHERQAQVSNRLLQLYGNRSQTHFGYGNVQRKSVEQLSEVTFASSRDSSLYTYLLADSPEYTDNEQIISRKGLLKPFYQDQATLYKLESKDFSFYLNPILNLSFGKEIDQVDPVFRNTRGFQLRGYIDDKVYFYTDLLETQANFLTYQNTRFDEAKSIDGQGFYKPYNSGVSSLNGFDFLNARGYVGLPISKHINIELGHGNHFIGHGYQSLLLNDYSQNYFYLALDTKVWKLHYKNVFAELAAVTSNLTGATKLLPKKYLAAHYLSYKPAPWFEIGLYEAVVFSREDHFEFQYLNPIILYRTVEQFLDSPDNVLLGVNGKIDLSKSLYLYGQFVLDELKINEIVNNSGWWGNKYGIQAGLFAYNFLRIDNLDVRGEFNLVRPFTYSHLWQLEGNEQFSTGSYSHFSQPLAHPLGSNFIELIGTASYVFGPKLYLNAKALYAEKGNNPDGTNIGADILLANGTRLSNFDNTLLQGNRVKILHGSVDLNYALYHNMTIKSTLTLHQQTGQDQVLYFGVGLLVNSFDFAVDY